MRPIIETRGLTKVFGANGMAVHALRGIDLTVAARRVRGPRRPVGLRQVDAHGDHRLPRLADGGLVRARRRERGGPVRRRARAHPQREDRLRLPELQPPAEGVDRSGTSSCRSSTRASARKERRRRALELLERVGIPEKANVLPGAALGRPAAARRDRARPREHARAPPRRRADGRARLEDGRGGPRPLPGAAPAGELRHARHARPAHRVPRRAAGRAARRPDRLRRPEKRAA